MKASERDDLIEEYGRGFDMWTAALAEIPREAWDFKPEPHEWSVHELILHMADGEANGAIRLRKLIAEPGGTIMAYDEDVWADALDYQGENAEDALLMFKLARRMSYRLLKTLPDEAFARFVVHPEKVYPEYGEQYTVEKWLQIYARHVRDHVRQLEKTHQAWKDRPVKA